VFHCLGLFSWRRGMEAGPLVCKAKSASARYQGESELGERRLPHGLENDRGKWCLDKSYLSEVVRFTRAGERRRCTKGMETEEQALGY
jgi:hypothetical protein